MNGLAATTLLAFRRVSVDPLVVTPANMPFALHPRQQIDKAGPDERLTPAEVDREFPDEFLDAEERPLPFLIGHLVLVALEAPVLAITTFDVAMLIDDPVERHRFVMSYPLAR